MGGRGYISSAASVALVLAVAGAAEASPRTVVVLSFDDGRASQLEALPILARHGMRGTFFLNSGSLGTNGYLDVSQARGLLDAGHEVGGHTLDHVDLVALPAEEAKRQVCTDRENLRALGLGPLESFAYPYGSSDRGTAALLWECGYRWGRSQGGLDEDGCNQGCVYAETFPPDHPLELRAPVSVSRRWSLSDLQDPVIRAEEGGGGLVAFAFHHLCEKCDYTYRVAPKVFEEFVAWLAERRDRGTVVLPLGEALEEERADDTPPSVDLIAPAPDSLLLGRIRLAASARDDDEVVAVAFFVGDRRVATVATPPWEAPWWAMFDGRAEIQLTARALDRSGNEGTSAPVSARLSPELVPTPPRGEPRPPWPRRPARPDPEITLPLGQENPEEPPAPEPGRLGTTGCSCSTGGTDLSPLFLLGLLAMGIGRRRSGGRRH
jgi:MYXO-CTERM domain-containing protein